LTHGADGADGSDFSELINSGITTADIKVITNLDEGIEEILVGNTLMLVDGYCKALIISSKGFPKRSVEKPENEAVIQGPKEAFTESLRVNTVLIRRRIRDTSLKCEQLKLGSVTKTDIALMYIEGSVDKKALAILRKRLDSLNVRAILDSGYVEQYIEDSTLSPFPQLQLTERPDKVAAELIEGRIAVVVDTSPFVILVPTVLASFYQSSEDYYERFEIMSFVRLIRYIAGFLAYTLPGLYIAVICFSPELLPTKLALRMAGERADIPISSLGELLIMELTFEALREAGIRLPSAIGSTLGIVGGIVIGQSAVEAGLVSPMVVIVVALTGICSFSIPNNSLISAYRLIKYIVLALSYCLGTAGFVIGNILVMLHLCSLKSFGRSYIEPFGGLGKGLGATIRDTIIRLPSAIEKERL
jgi:spore germination protein